MKLTFQSDVIGLSAETPEEKDICDLLARADGYVFQLHASSGRGMHPTRQLPFRPFPREFPNAAYRRRGVGLAA